MRRPRNWSAFISATAVGERQLLLSKPPAKPASHVRSAGERKGDRSRPKSPTLSVIEESLPASSSPPAASTSSRSLPASSSSVGHGRNAGNHWWPWSVTGAGSVQQSRSGNGDSRATSDLELSSSGQDAQSQWNVRLPERTRSLAAPFVVFLLSVLAVLTQVTFVIMQPAVQGALEKHIVCGKPRRVGGIYFSVFFSAIGFFLVFGLFIFLAVIVNRTFSLRCAVPHSTRFIAGSLCSLTYVLNMYASPAGRTPYFIQPLLSTGIVPVTVVARLIILKKGISKVQTICAFATIIGVLIAMEPVMFGIESRAEQASISHRRALESVVWSLLYLASVTPYAVQAIVEERAMKKISSDTAGSREVNPLLFAFWVNFWSLVFIALFFFVDFIPWFGESNNFNEFSSSMQSGFRCMFGSTPSPLSFPNCSAHFMNRSASMYNPDPSCHTPIFRMWLYCTVGVLNSTTIIALIKSSQGAVFASLVIILTAPVGSVFWMLVELNHLSVFHWRPTFESASAYTFIGLTITVPAIAVFQFFECKEKHKQLSSS